MRHRWQINQPDQPEQNHMPQKKPGAPTQQSLFFQANSKHFFTSCDALHPWQYITPLSLPVDVELLFQLYLD